MYISLTVIIPERTKRMNKVKEIFSKNLNQCLKDKKITATEVAKKIKVSRTAISDWCNEKKHHALTK